MPNQKLTNKYNESKEMDDFKYSKIEYFEEGIISPGNPTKKKWNIVILFWVVLIICLILVSIFLN